MLRGWDLDRDRTLELLTAVWVDNRRDPTARVGVARRSSVYLLSVAESPPLTEAYHRLSIPSLMTRMFVRHNHASPELVDDHVALVEAYERGYLQGVKTAIALRTERAKTTNAAAIRAGGGRV